MVYKPKMKSRGYQRKALKKAQGKDAFAFLMAMRTGKTKVALDEFGTMELENEVNDQLVIAPAGVYHTWEGAMRDHLSEDILDRMLVHTYTSGAGVGERRRLDEFLRTLDHRRPRTLLLNVEALSRPGPARELVKHYLAQRPGKNLTEIDESTVIKNSSKRTDFVNKFVTDLSAYRRILSGLATPRSPLDLYHQFYFLDWRILGFKSWYAFRARVAILQDQWFGSRRVPIVVGYRDEAVEELREKIEPHSFRVEFRPKIPSTWSIHEVEMTPEQVKAYAEMKEFCTTQLSKKGGHISATVVIAQITKLHQILCGHVIDEEGIERTIPENRTDELLGILEEYNGKAIIWCTYDHDVQKVSDALKKDYGEKSVARFWGGNLRTREAEEQQFKGDPACRFMVATASAGGRGRTWTVADLIIYYSCLNNLEHREQSEQRSMDYDKEVAADFIDLIVPGTVEMKTLEALRAKIDLATVINGDNYKEWII